MIANILFLPVIEENGDVQGFSDNVILDPHNDLSSDPDRIIFIYKYSVNQLIYDYYYSKKKKGLIKAEFNELIQQQEVLGFLRQNNPAPGRLYTYASHLSKLLHKTSME